MLLGCIADDFTGASDLANTLAKNGMATVQFVGVPRGRESVTCEAGVVALKTRSIAPAEAVRQSLEALHWLQAQGCSQFLFKYCSTFDSTPEGNIGPVAEALLDALDVKVAVVCPIFPETGRTLYQGHLFVKDRLLSESGMENHPLNPMTDPDIRRWLRRQTRGEVGLVSYDIVRQGAAAIRDALDHEAGADRRLAVVDAVTNDDLRAIGAAIADHGLVTGGSGIAVGLPENFRKAGKLGATSAAFTGLKGPGVVLSGSCSTASRAQLARHLDRHPGFAVEPEAVLSGATTVDQALAFVRDHIDLAPAVHSTADPDRVAAAQQRFGRERVAGAIERFFGALAHQLVRAGVTRLAVGGGETSGAVVTALALDHFAIGPEIDPGVPALASRGSGREIRLALKSGNFGAVDFYDKALRVLERA
ncbi:3-oxo-tetronate kinase [Lichenifustis flavocetrariae]|uniref:3-oxo-tetronate kinase n=1 Tax=Lichenifustis flavocetrariae TaxID=2949735 RepID=A0AA41Z1C5_9HYPH|nr:3-oxo-tetronate kinase [Lichenifustis flavocetrariae]MCW6508590.1 four-carbon acid sugar kinase family protein [Lichenifustis flavocetrariae]